MKAFVEPFRQLGIYEELAGKLKKNRGVLWLSGCVDSQKIHGAYALWQGYSRRLLITYSEQKAKEIYEDCRYFDREAVLYQAKDFLFFHADIQGNLLVQQRVRALQALLTKPEVTVITSIVPASIFSTAPLLLRMPVVSPVWAVRSIRPPPTESVRVRSPLLVTTVAVVLVSFLPARSSVIFAPAGIVIASV